MTAGPEAVYDRRRRRFGERAGEEAGRARRLTLGRALSFAAALALGLAAEWTSGGWPPVLWAGAAASAAGFAVLVARHRRARRRQRWSEELAEVNRRAGARRRRAWDELPEPATAAAPAPGEHPYASDLDLFGAASVRTLLGTVATAPGAARLRAWLLDAARPDAAPGPEETRARQRRVEALAGRLEFRDALAAHGRLGGSPDPGAVERFVDWAEADPWLPSHPAARWAAWLLPLATWTLAAGHLAGVLGLAWWVLPVLATLGLADRTSRAVHGRFERAGAGEAAFDRWAASLELVTGLAGEPHLDDVARPVADGGRDAPGELRRLGRWVHLADARHGLMHFFLQVLFCWDLHVLRGLERWQRRCGPRVRGWIGALARADALSALAALRHAHPGWSFPEVAPGARTLEAEALGHPLLPPDDCVPNDVTVGPPGTFLFVTGSNMSGKSTLLRALGVNTVLGRAGAPVCARRMRLPPLEVRTSIRVEDSVVRGVSQYMAELRRVRAAVEAARRRAPGDADDGAAGTPGPRPGAAAGQPETTPDAPPRLLYLLDEPLQGTNEAERREAVRIILRELLARGAVGAVATHDLRLHETRGLREAARPVHFRGRVRAGAEGPDLDFDFRLRDGPATSTNALDLLRLAGLGDPE